MTRFAGGGPGGGGMSDGGDDSVAQHAAQCTLDLGTGAWRGVLK